MYISARVEVVRIQLLAWSNSVFWIECGYLSQGTKILTLKLWVYDGAKPMEQYSKTTQAHSCFFSLTILWQHILRQEGVGCADLTRRQRAMVHEQGESDEAAQHVRGGVQTVAGFRIAVDVQYPA